MIILYSRKIGKVKICFGSQFFRKEVFIQKVKLHVNPLKVKYKENCKILSDLPENMNDL